MMQCTKCKIIKDDSEFYKRQAKKNGLHSWCKTCKDELDVVCKQREIYKKAHAKREQLYRQTPSGRITDAKHRAKRRNLGFIRLFPNPFDKSVEIDWHHINNEYVVAMPRDLHKLYQQPKDTNMHRELCMNVISQLYGVMP